MRHSRILPGLLVFALAVMARAQDDQPKVFNLKTINTPANESEPALSSDNKTLYYSTDARDNWDIWVSTREERGSSWGKGEPETSNINTNVDDTSGFLTPDGIYSQFFYFATMKDREAKNFDIYVVQRFRKGAILTSPTPVNKVCTAEDELHPWLSASGRSLLFSRKTKDGFRIYIASRKETAGATGFEKVTLIKELPVGFHHATLTPDARTMYLQGPLDEGRIGLFVSKRPGTKWSKPLPLNVNHSEGKIGDFAPCLSRDGMALYFASDRPGGAGKSDLYAVSVKDLKAVESD